MGKKEGCSPQICVYCNVQLEINGMMGNHETCS